MRGGRLMGMREIIWAIIAVLAVYVALQLLRLGRKPRPVAPAPAASEVADDPPTETPAVDELQRPAPVEARIDRAALVEMERMGLELQQLRRDVAQLRSEQEAQRRELQRLADEASAMRDSVATVQAGQHVSPQYGEAVMLARRGLASDAIAERCGISVAEAALVRSLASGDGDTEGARNGE